MILRDNLPPRWRKRMLFATLNEPAFLAYFERADLLDDLDARDVHTVERAMAALRRAGFSSADLRIAQAALDQEFGL